MNNNTNKYYKYYELLKVGDLHYKDPVEKRHQLLKKNQNRDLRLKILNLDEEQERGRKIQKMTLHANSLIIGDFQKVQ